jgi:carboxymethylenebutenolidase
MGLHTEWVRYGNDSQYLGYFARPQRATEHLPAVIVLQEIWGVDDHIEDVTRRFAQAGYAALAPDLYAPGGQRPPAVAADRVEAMKRFLDSLPPTAWGNEQERAAALEKLPKHEAEQISETQTTLFGGLRGANHVPQMLATAHYLRSDCAASKGQPVVSIGYCMGGALSALLACHDEALKGACVFYGTAPSADLIKSIQCSVLGFYGGLDTRVNESIPGFAQAMKDIGKHYESHVYEGAHHAFFNDTRSSYNAAAARHAWARVLSFFNEVTHA